MGDLAAKLMRPVFREGGMTNGPQTGTSRLDGVVESSTARPQSDADYDLRPRDVGISYRKKAAEKLLDKKGKSIVSQWRAGELPVETVKISDISMIQNGVKADGVRGYIEDPTQDGYDHGGRKGEYDRRLPVVARSRGSFFLVDGTHRTVAMKLRGAKKIRARVVDV